MFDFSVHLIRAVLRILILAAAFCVPFWLSDLSGLRMNHLLHGDVFYEIQLDMDRNHVVSILREHGIQCEMTGATDRQANTCEFQDYWHSYFIAVNPETGLVTRKEYGFVRHKNLLERIEAFLQG